MLVLGYVVKWVLNGSLVWLVLISMTATYVQQLAQLMRWIWAMSLHMVGVVRMGRKLMW